MKELCFAVLSWRRPSWFVQWLLGAVLLMLLGWLLHAAGRKYPAQLSGDTASASLCLKAAGTDLKFSESLYREMLSSAGCASKNAKVSR